MRPGLVCLIALCVACGGDDGPSGPSELIADPNVVTGCQADPVPAGSSRAKVVACAAELPAGRLVSGRVGDIVLENSKIEVVIRGFGEGYYLMGTKAGGIVDAARLGASDQVKEVLPIAGLHAGGFTEFVITESGDDGPATVVVRGELEIIDYVAAAVTVPPVEAIIEHHYVLEPDATEVRLRTFLFPVDGSTGNIQVGDVFFYGGVIDSWLPRKGVIEGAANSDLIASLGGDTSYGIAYTPDVSVIQFADIANVKVGLGASRTLGNTDPIERWFIIGDGSAASVTDRAWALRGAETGTIAGTTAPDVFIQIYQGQDPITVARSSSSGSYSASVPPGVYSVWTESPGRAPGATQMVTVTAGAQASADLPAGGTGTLSLQVRDDGGNPIPSRVVLFDTNNARRIEYTGATGNLELALPPGDYTVNISRGVEYDAFTADPLTITDGQSTPLMATLNKVLDTSGWISVDTHMHTEMSTDSKITLDARLLSVAAEGVEIAISTDHDFVTDYSPVVAELGLSSFLTSQVGIEASSISWGHVNGWPMEPNYDKPAGDGIPWFNVAPGVVYQRMHDRGSNVVVQQNHPYSGSSGGLDIVDFDPDTLTSGKAPVDLGLPSDQNLDDFSFDALEIANDFNSDDFAIGFAAYLAMVAAGHPAAATGSSDSHGRSRFIGKSRTYVYVGPGNDDPATVDLDAVNAAIKARKVIVSQGAFVTAEIIDPADGQPAAPGEMVNLNGASDAQLRIKVQAPPWMPLASIEIWSGKVLQTTLNLSSSETAAVRYDNTITVSLDSSDGFFIVLVRPAGPGTPVLGTPDASFTNPLLYDRDGDGAWTPAGS